MIVRAIVVVIAATLLAVQVVRSAVVASFAESRPDIAGRVWSGHPAVEISSAMTGIAVAARDRRPVPASTFDLMADAADRAPLADAPYLVRGVQAELAGDTGLAQRAFEAAQWRDPRSLPAAYFLADRYFRTGDARRGLQEVAALSRLSPTGATTIGPYIAVYARNPANWPAIKGMFRTNPQLERSALITLASNLATVPAVLALQPEGSRVANADWVTPLLNTLVGAGQYAQARAIWAKASAVKSDGIIYDLDFRDRTSPAPFNWALSSSTVGLAERTNGGQLHILFYGQEDGILASQLLLLQPGSYRLSMSLGGDATRARSLTWSIWCDKAAAPRGSATLDAAASGWRFDIPAACPAQWLRLSGASSDISQQVDVSIGQLKLVRLNSDA